MRNGIHLLRFQTSIIRRFTEDVFSPNYKLTIGVDFSLKTLFWGSETKINLQLWDIAGHERFGHMTRVYYKYAIAAIIVFDLTRQVTFESVLKWLGDVNQKVVLENGDGVPVILLANKVDVETASQVDQNQLDSFCKKNNILGWFATSAKEATNITESMEYLVKHILELSSKQQDSPADVISLGDEANKMVAVATYNGTDEVDYGGGYASEGYASDGYAKVSKMNGLVSHDRSLVEGSNKPTSKSNSCCT